MLLGDNRLRCSVTRRANGEQPGALRNALVGASVASSTPYSSESLIRSVSRWFDRNSRASHWDRSKVSAVIGTAKVGPKNSRADRQ
jgi:hypothetical protein